MSDPAVCAELVSNAKLDAAMGAFFMTLIAVVLTVFITMCLKGYFATWARLERKELRERRRRAMALIPLGLSYGDAMQHATRQIEREQRDAYHALQEAERETVLLV